MPNAQLGSCFLKQRRQIALAARKPVGKLKAVVRLDTLDLDAAACIPRCQFAEKVRRRVGGLLRVSREKAQTSELINGGVLTRSPS